MSAQSQLGKSIEDLARELDQGKKEIDKCLTSATLQDKNNFNEMAKLLISYSGLIEKLEEHGINAQDASEQYVARISEMVAGRVAELLPQIKPEEVETALKKHSRPAESQQIEKHVASYLLGGINKSYKELTQIDKIKHLKKYADETSYGRMFLEAMISKLQYPESLKVVRDSHRLTIDEHSKEHKSKSWKVVSIESIVKAKTGEVLSEIATHKYTPQYLQSYDAQFCWRLYLLDFQKLVNAANELYELLPEDVQRNCSIKFYPEDK